jgi:hypothetical protein
MHRRLLPLALAVLAPLVANGQEARPIWSGNRVINQPTNLPVGPGTLQVVFTHRFLETVSDAGGYDLLGFDSAASIGIGLDYGLGRDLDVSLLRGSFLKEMEASAKWTLTRQGEAFPLGCAVRAGADYRGAKGIDDRWSGFAQLVLARRFGERLDVFLLPSYASDTPTLKNATNLAVAASWYLPKQWHLSAEVVPENRDAAGGAVAWAFGIAKRLPGHEFLIYVGNAPATTTDLMVGSDMPGGFRAGDARIGFNLLRRFPE